jgi:DNA-binding Lrp family transcriptional regulator
MNVRHLRAHREITSLKPDAIDSKILEALMEDGRASLSKIARKTSLTTPTVSARVDRMKRAGLIKKFVPILSADSVDRGVLALVTIRVASTFAEKFARDLAKLEEVEDVYMTTGQGITLKVVLGSVRDLQPFLSKISAGRPGIEVTSSQIITSVVKEEAPSLLPRVLNLNLKCDYCDGQVTSGRPYTISVGASHYYFCCKTCKKDYLERYGAKLAKLGHTQATGTLQS